jgi:hypothetical protein
MIVTCHQPLFLPWIPYFNRLTRANVFLVLDDVAYRKNYYMNRTLIEDTALQTHWLTAPVRRNRLGTPISEIVVCSDEPAMRKSINRLIETYRSSSHPYLNEVLGRLASSPRRLIDLDIDLIDLTLTTLALPKPEFILISSIVPKGEPGDRILEALKRLGAKSVIVGMGAMASVNNVHSWADAGIELMYQRPAADVFGAALGLRRGVSILNHLVRGGTEETRAKVSRFWFPCDKIEVRRQESVDVI